MPEQPVSSLTTSFASGASLLRLAAAVAGLPALSAPAAEPVPPGAAALGYTRCVIDEKPVAAHIAPGKNGKKHQWFSGQWWAEPIPLDKYTTTSGTLVLKPGGELVSAPRDFSPGKLPLLSGARGFYVEFEVRLSSNDPDHFPAVWLMPAEHNSKMEDQYPGDPPNFQRWMEFDIDEGGFGPGMAGTVHSGWGIWPKVEQVQNPNNLCTEPLDRSKTHTFGGSYDPDTLTVTWWLDGVKQMSAGEPYVPKVALKQNYYLIMSNQTHGKNVPYDMFISRVRAYEPPPGKKKTTPPAKGTTPAAGEPEQPNAAGETIRPAKPVEPGLRPVPKRSKRPAAPPAPQLPANKKVALELLLRNGLFHRA